MTKLSVGAKIWAKTVALNAVFFALNALFNGDPWSFFGSFLVLIGGFIFTLPLLIIIVPLVQLSVIIPYSIKARVASLTFFMMCIIIAFYGFLLLIMGGGLDDILLSLVSATIAGLLVAIYTTRTSLLKLYHQHDEAQLLINNHKI